MNVNNVVIPGDRNVFKKETEKIIKYKDLIIEIQLMWNVKAKVLPVISGATGAISDSLRPYLSNISFRKKLSNSKKKKPYGALHTHCGKC